MKNLKFLIIILAMTATMMNVAAQDKKGKTPASKKMTKPMKKPMASENITRAICVINPTEGNQVKGIVTFTKTTGGVEVSADLKGLSKGKHGMHIHECGDCSSLDGSSAGGHFNPLMKNHGGPMDAMRHEGDMGNIEADETGTAHLSYVDKMISFDGKYSIIGRSVIVHQGEDDLKSQPAGNAGSRVGCGVIGIAK